MALTLESINLVKQRTRWQTLNAPGAVEALRSLWQHMEQKGNPDLQFVKFEKATTNDVVLADVPCRIYAIYYKKPAASTTASWMKISDHATVCSTTGDIEIPLAAAAAAGKEGCVVFHDGLSMAIGATWATHTALAGNTDSNAADTPAGFVIVGPA